jgi:hypothetical protein
MRALSIFAGALLLLGLIASTPLLSGCHGDLPDGGLPTFHYDFCPADAGTPPAHASGPSPGCARSGGATGVVPLGDVVAALDGLLVVPPAAAAGAPLPLVLIFHGAFQDAVNIRNRYGIEEAADGGAVFAYLEAAAGTWALGQSVDLRHVDRVVRTLEDTYCVDQDRIFAAGFSAGAVFAHWTGCVRSDTFRGVAATAGTVVRFDTHCCRGNYPAIMIHGMADTSISYGDGLQSRARLLAANACSTTGVPVDDHCLDYPGCLAGTAVEWCGHPGGHDIPDWAGAEVWRFFERLP